MGSFPLFPDFCHLYHHSFKILWIFKNQCKLGLVWVLWLPVPAIEIKHYIVLLAFSTDWLNRLCWLVPCTSSIGMSKKAMADKLWTFQKSMCNLAFPDACLKSCLSVLSVILMRYLSLIYKFAKQNLMLLCLDFVSYFIMYVLRVLDAVKE